MILNNHAQQNRFSGRFSHKLISAAAWLVCLVGVVWVTFNVNAFERMESIDGVSQRSISAQFEQGMDNLVSDALGDIYGMKKIYVIPESQVVAPAPDPGCYGEVSSLEELDGTSATAEQYELVSASDLVYHNSGELWRDTPVKYYLDESIYAVAWKTAVGRDIFNYIEVVVAHPSQFRRYLTDDRFGSNTRTTASVMSKNLNAVIGASADFYAYRGPGVVVYKGKLCRKSPGALDNCFIDGNGDIIMTKRGTLAARDIESFIADNGINFSLSFGPILVENGEVAKNVSIYPIGEVTDQYSRAGIGQIGKLHYLLCTVDGGVDGCKGTTTEKLAAQMMAMGCRSAYTLDGGQTATLVVNNGIFNRVGYGNERLISDLIYFATAIPEDQRGVTAQ